MKAPIVFNKALWQTSGHWDYYQDNMFLVKSSDGEEMGLKPMNCPGHFLLFGTEKRSYQDLPLRFHEQTPLHRNEASGTLSGLTRVRQFSQDDGHCFVMQEQIAAEVEALIKLDPACLRRLRAELRAPSCRRGPRNSSVKSRRGTTPRRASGARSRASQQAYTLNAGDGAFYGPKIDFDITDALGRKWQCGTIQLDYQMPERFDLKYVGADNAEHRPVVIHRAIFGSLERFIAHPDRAFCRRVPAVAGAAAGDRPADCRSPSRLRPRGGGGPEEAGLKAEVDDRQEKVNYKIREAQLQKIPYMLVVGDREAADRAVAVRSHAKGRSGRPAAGPVRGRRACRGPV